MIPMLDWFRNAMARESQHHEPAPMLDALLPILEYTYDQLKFGGFDDAFLTAGIRARARIQRAAAELRPLGIFEPDLCLLLQERMKEQLKLKREEVASQRKRRRK
jgi:hypothetical protein